MSREEEKPVYHCIWNKKIVCTVRTQYKLSPESLILFCKVCVELPLNKRKYPDQPLS